MVVQYLHAAWPLLLSPIGILANGEPRVAYDLIYAINGRQEGSLAHTQQNDMGELQLVPAQTCPVPGVQYKGIVYSSITLICQMCACVCVYILICVRQMDPHIVTGGFTGHPR